MEREQIVYSRASFERMRSMRVVCPLPGKVRDILVAFVMI
jgi:hypothetical protein